jgi:hypothetical protein
MTSYHKIAKRSHGITNLNSANPNPSFINNANITNSLNHSFIVLELDTRVGEI